MNPRLLPLLGYWCLLVGLTVGAVAAQRHADLPVPTPNPVPTSYAATLERAIDGDTYILRVELGFDTLKRATIRLEGLDTPELRAEGGLAARDDAEKLLRTAAHVEVTPTGARTFARYVARIRVCSETCQDLAAALRAMGHEKKGSR